MIFLAWCAIAAAPVVEDLGGGRINWTTLELEAEVVGQGSGGLGDYDVTEGEARSRLGPRILELARRVRIDRETTAGEILSAGDALADAVDGNLALWEVDEATYFASGRVSLTATLPLEKWLRPAMVQRATAVERASPGGVGPSGLVVDARGLEVRPSLAPRLLGEDGVVVYDSASLTPAAATLRGPVVWVTDPADTRAVRRAGEQPLFVRASTVDASYDLRLPSDDVARVRDGAATWSFLRQGAVVIVVSP